MIFSDNFNNHISANNIDKLLHDYNAREQLKVPAQVLQTLNSLEP